MYGYPSRQTRRRFVGATLLTFAATIGVSTVTRADMVFDDDESESGADGDDSGSNSRVEDHRLNHANLAELVLPHAYVQGDRI